MIFACGVRFIRSRSLYVSGSASGSASAAFSIASALIGRRGLAVLPEVVVLLMLGCPPRRNNANALVAFGIRYKQHNVAFRHADDDKALLAIVLAIIEALDGERILEYRHRQLEAHAMGFQVGLGFDVVPLEFQFHDTSHPGKVLVSFAVESCSKSKRFNRFRRVGKRPPPHADRDPKLPMTLDPK
jgi:hypothetical protein